MKRSVNFSAPRQFALMAAMRNSLNEEWLADMLPETRQRFEADYKTLIDLSHIISLPNEQGRSGKTRKRKIRSGVGISICRTSFKRH